MSGGVRAGGAVGASGAAGAGGAVGASAPLAQVFAPGAIGPLALEHRIVMGSMHVGLESAEDDGRALAAFYAERAAGGAGLIVTGGWAVSRVGAGGRSYGFVNEDAFASALARIADAVHEAGGRVLLQLFHAGRYAFEGAFGLRPVAPSAVYSPFSRCEPRALTGAEVRDIVDQFAAGAARAAQLGYDGVELMGSEGYLLNQFTAPATNRRDDEWGGDGDRRMRFPLAVARACRAALGPSGAVVYRLSGTDLVDGGTPHEEVLALARALAADTRSAVTGGPDDARAGPSGGSVDAINVGIGWHEARVPTVQLVVPLGAWRPWARAVRDAVDGRAPVIASNRINTLALADDVLAAGDADFVSLARPFLADAQLVKRVIRRGPVNVCIGCDQACIDRSIFDRRVSCIVNPRAGHELELPTVGLSGSSVAVVGGGPAGLEAARSLASCGAAVTLFEAGERLGGQFRMAHRIPGKQDYERTIEYFESELAVLGVDVHLRSPVDDVESLRGFDAVVVATGVTPRPVSIPGAELGHVLTYAELLSGDRALPGGDVAIIGAGGIGVDVAQLLSSAPGGGDPRQAFYDRHDLRPPARNGEQAWTGQANSPNLDRAGRDGPGRPSPDGPGRPGRGAPRGKVTLIRRGDRIGDRLGPSTRWAVLDELKRAGVQLLTGVAYERIEPGAVQIRDADQRPRAIPADTVVICAGQRSEDALAGQLAANRIPHTVIGGAARADELDAERAFRDGLETPARLKPYMLRA